MHWRSEQALTHAIGVATEYFYTAVKAQRAVEMGRYLVARWGVHGPHELTMYATDDVVVVEHYSDEVELSGGKGLRRVVFRAVDASWALRYFAALHWELDDETVAATCAFDDPRCPNYRPPTTQRAQQP